MAKQTEQNMRDLTIYDDLITSLIILKVILEDIDKISKVTDLGINNKIKQLELIEEELRIMTIRNRFFWKTEQFQRRRNR